MPADSWLARSSLEDASKRMFICRHLLKLSEYYFPVNCKQNLEVDSMRTPNTEVVYCREQD